MGENTRTMAVRDWMGLNEFPMRLKNRGESKNVSKICR